MDHRNATGDHGSAAMRTLCVIFLMLAAPLAQAADPVGRIFFTPEQRAQLDNLRTQKAVASRVRDEPVPETVTYNGIVRRSDGKATIWINNEALSETDLRNRQSMIGRIGRDGRISLQSPAVELKVGQSATTFSGKVDESFMQRPATAVKPPPETAGKAAPPAQVQPSVTPGISKTPEPAASPRADPKT